MFQQRAERPFEYFSTAKKDGERHEGALPQFRSNFKRGLERRSESTLVNNDDVMSVMSSNTDRLPGRPRGGPF